MSVTVFPKPLQLSVANAQFCLFAFFRPVFSGLLQPFSGDRNLPEQKRSQLDRLYQRVVDDLNKLMDAVGVKAA